jgi:hypothetical protein
VLVVVCWFCPNSPPEALVVVPKPGFAAPVLLPNKDPPPKPVVVGAFVDVFPIPKSISPPSSPHKQKFTNRIVHRLPVAAAVAAAQNQSASAPSSTQTTLPYPPSSYSPAAAAAAEPLQTIPHPYPEPPAVRRDSYSAERAVVAAGRAVRRGMFAVGLVVGRMLEVGLLVAPLELVGRVGPRSLRTFGGLACVVGGNGETYVECHGWW